MIQDQYLAALNIPVWKYRDKNQGLEEMKQPLSSEEKEKKWEILEKEVSGCPVCPVLYKNRTQTVFGVGDKKAKLLLVGEAPGAQEDLKGEPFVGQAGQLLDKMLLAIQLTRKEIYIANILKCRPPKNRAPEPEEVHHCTPFLIRQIELLQPKIIVALGRISAHYLLNTTTKLGALREKWFEWGEKKIPLRVTYHPAYLLRNPADKRKAWEDLKVIQKFYNDLN